LEVREEDLLKRRTELEREIDRLQQQLQQAQQAIQSIPLMIASRRGEIIGIDRLLKENTVKAKKK